MKKDWCQGFCTLCGTGCAEYCEELWDLREKILSQLLMVFSTREDLPDAYMSINQVVDLIKSLPVFASESSTQK